MLVKPKLQTVNMTKQMSIGKGMKTNSHVWVECKFEDKNVLVCHTLMKYIVFTQNCVV